MVLLLFAATYAYHCLLLKYGHALDACDSSSHVSQVDYCFLLSVRWR